jgi:hypothetical protein
MVESRIASMSESSVGPTQCLRRCRRIVNRIPRPTLYPFIDSVLCTRFSHRPCTRLNPRLNPRRYPRLNHRLKHRRYPRLCTPHSVIRTPHSVLFALPKKVPHLCRFRLELHCILDLGGRYVATARTRPVGSHLPYIMFVGKGGCRGCRTLQGTVNLAGLVVKSKRVGGTGVILGRLEARKVACDTPASCSSA